MRTRRRLGLDALTGVLARLHPGLAELQGVELAGLIRDLHVERDLVDETVALMWEGADPRGAPPERAQGPHSPILSLVGAR